MSTATISLIIMGICIVLFVTEWLPGATAAMLGCVAMVAFGVCSFSDILSGFGGMIVWLVFAMQIIGLAMLRREPLPWSENW
jgi:Na+/H+ antiporter NhaD/arsenite permease-like protein